MSKITAAITAVGGYVPDYVLSNQILETMVDTNDEWITARTGIKERRILKDKDEIIKIKQLLIDSQNEVIKRYEYLLRLLSESRQLTDGLNDETTKKGNE